MSELSLFSEVPKSADFHSVVMTTFSFDFHHFESQVLRELKRKGVTNVNVFADTAMLDKSIGLATGRLKSLSKAYSINGIPCTGSFHPKITLLAGYDNVLLLQGSGNITNGGHGKNHELFTAFYATKEDQSQLPIIQEAWLYLRQLSRGIQGLSADKLKWVGEDCSLLQNINIQAHSFSKISDGFSAALVYNEETSIWQQLNTLIPTVSVQEIKVFSPFYDEKGTLISRLLDQYPNSKMDAYLQSERGIHPFKLEHTDRLRFLSWDSTKRAQDMTAKYQRKLHSKLFWFDAGDQHYCLIGSANATLKAFGTDTSRGANDEFSVLIKVDDKRILEELKLVGKTELISPTDNADDAAIESEVLEEQTKSRGKIKLLGVDQDASRLTLYIHNKTALKKAVLALYDKWGVEVEQQSLDLSNPKIKFERISSLKGKAVTYAQFVDKAGESLSNKQIVSNFHDLSNTNPSVANRSLMKLSSLIENGSSGTFDIVEFYMTLQSNRMASVKKTSKGSEHSAQDEQDKEPAPAASLTYDEAIALDQSNQEHNNILRQHSSIRIWDSIERYFRELILAEEEDDMDDEEEGNANTGRKRNEKKERSQSVQLNSIKVLERRRKSIEKFLSNYSVSLDRRIASGDKVIGLVDMAMYLIVLDQLAKVSGKEVEFKEAVEGVHKGVLYPLHGKSSELSNYSGATLNLIGKFVNLLYTSSFDEGGDEYTKKKMKHYITLVRRTSLFCLATLSEVNSTHQNMNEWAALLAHNIIDRCGNLEKGYEKHLSTFYRKLDIKELEGIQLFERIESWAPVDTYQEYFMADKLGICRIEKRIPAEGELKFVKLSRPGFEYDDDKSGFVLSQLYNCITRELNPSLQDFNKSKQALIN